MKELDGHRFAILLKHGLAYADSAYREGANVQQSTVYAELYRTKVIVEMKTLELYGSYDRL